jgi:anti-sigma regulatory factor (Ser/Thr protein kinase)
LERTLRLDGLQGLDRHRIDGLFRDLAAALAEAGVPRGAAFAVNTVAEELCANIMEHSGATWLELGLTGGAQRVNVRLRDDGRPFDPAERLNHLSPQEALQGQEERHLGLYMVRHLAQGFRYRRDPDGCNQVDFEVPADAGPENPIR